MSPKKSCDQLRGSAINAKGGTNTLYAQDYAARVALELGADIVKLHEPNDSVAGVPAPYDKLQEDAATRCARVVRSAGRTMVLFSGGEKNDDDAAVLRAALIESQLPADKLFELAQTQEVKDGLLTNTQRSVDRGTFGSPTFFVGNEIYFGKDRLRDVEEAIRCGGTGQAGMNDA